MDLTPLGGSPAVAVGQLGDDPAFKLPENIVKYPTLPDVNFSDKTLLIVMGHPFSGTSALEGLIGTGNGVTDLCDSGTWQCEDTWLLKYMNFDIEPGVDEWDDSYPVDAAGYAYAFKHFAQTWWDMSKPVLMDKTPNLLAHYRTVVGAAEKLGVPVKFVLLTRHPFSWTSETHPFNQGLWMQLMQFSLKVLNDPSIEVHQVKYEDLAWNLDETIKSLQAFLPQLGELDPWGSALEEPKDAEAKEINGDRAMGIAQYFQRELLDWRPLPWTMRPSRCSARWGTTTTASASTDAVLKKRRTRVETVRNPRAARRLFARFRAASVKAVAIFETDTHTHTR